MSNNEILPPPNQDIESLCYLETMFQEHGFDDGFKDGEKSGELEGRIFGCEKAFDLGKEIGFYSGCVDMWYQLSAEYPEMISSKITRQLEGLQKTIDQFPNYNDHEVDLFALKDKMKNKLRVISSLLGVQQKYSSVETPKMTY
ncbi:hypothetical protein G6F62_013473 [Rhizopus arrhizus]|uniref:Essential protein Yae1 N-terminal domain-containing protein n=1 Tax=Rhizopus oryzae TaxID=64495 RepID=A0A9P6WX50_RHIOR|nr:hypothetical protein G6F22_012277 [Rhizopus arrhizus]KAG1396335.1 hypothetical protein G6F58_011763 [Rhizopus delemar]KAG0954438.1 hypothetical protein G6F31_013145 [Rhizopus arrhizus]KAG1165602.1 hypothetical protein G6F36_013274 [Rhizopus arrhizus]KAG1276698.1 hypothetical protein G6F66_012474 [Rhizopus arrhizus]